MRRTVTGVREGVSAGNSQGCPFGAREAPECSAENPREPGVTRSQPRGGRGRVGLSVKWENGRKP